MLQIMAGYFLVLLLVVYAIFMLGIAAYGRVRTRTSTVAAFLIGLSLIAAACWIANNLAGMASLTIH